MLKVAEVSLHFGGVKALQNVSLQVGAGELVALIGPNGAGKTSLFNVISGLYEPTLGSVAFQGRALKRKLTIAQILKSSINAGLLGLLAQIATNAPAYWPELTAVPAGQFGLAQLLDLTARILSNESLLPFLLTFAVSLAAQISYHLRRCVSPEHVAHVGISRTFQSIRLFPQMTVKENILIACEAKGRRSLLTALLRPARKADLLLVQELLELLGLSEEAEMQAGSLPYGLQRRLEIARALACQPKMILLDEPACGLNPRESAELLELIERIRKRGLAVLLIEHDMRLVMGCAERIYVLDHGCLIAEGNPDQVRSNAKVREAYLGESA